jgi:hypothetical protein
MQICLKAPPNSKIYRHLQHPPIHTKVLHHWSYNSFEALRFFVTNPASNRPISPLFAPLAFISYILLWRYELFWGFEGKIKREEKIR